MKADKEAQDRGEPLAIMEPLLVSTSSRFYSQLADLALDLTAKSTALRANLPEGITSALADLVRSMNCYYSNLIEGHDTHPIDIERALNEDYSTDPKKRDLQLEAKAHIAVQQWIDDGHLDGKATTTNGLLAIHQHFYEQLPDELSWVENQHTQQHQQVLPGQLRTRDVRVGHHIALSAGALPRFMARFQQAYGNLGKVDTIISAASAHHRFLWLHPFLDGNGRVARLMSYAILRDALDTGGIWSVARGLARNEAQYKKQLAQCDLPWRNDFDGRGNLSEEALAEFAAFFLKTCIDQVVFMEQLINPKQLHSRILTWGNEEIQRGHLPQKSHLVLEAILYRGTINRGEVAKLLATSERNARRVTSSLLEQGVLSSSSTRAPLKLNFPVTLASRWMPGLFPDQ